MKRLLLLSVLLLISYSSIAQGWGQTQKIVPDDRLSGQQFGSAVDIDGNYAVVGVFANGGSEEAYVFENDGNGNWVQIQKLESEDPHQFAHFGSAVAISGDYIFVGSWGQHYDESLEDSDYVQSAGAAYIFKKEASGFFEFKQKIVASDREALNAFGYGLAVDGDYAIVSPVRHDYNVTPGSDFLNDAGAAYIFEKDGAGIWNEVQKIVASDRGVQDFFGQTALAVDGDYIAVGSYGEDEDEIGTNTLSAAGSVYIFKRDTNSDVLWNQIQKIVASDREAVELFGWSIGLDGDTLVVGASQEYATGNVNAQYGAVYIFERAGNGLFNEVQKIRPDNLEHNSKFGHVLDIDGTNLVIGAYLMDVGNILAGGAAFMFEKDGTSIWNQAATMYDPNASSSDYFGHGIAVSGDYAMVGAYQEDEDETGLNFLQEAGSMYTFDVNEPNTLDPLATLSIVESDFQTSINAYPNPSDGLLNLDLGNNFESILINIYNIIGQKVFSKTFTDTRAIQLELDQPKGLYLVEVKTNRGITSVIKVVKN